MSGIDTLVVVCGYAVALWGGECFVETCLSRLVLPEESKEIDAFVARGLTRGGRWIGLLERFLTCTFVLTESYAAIGLVLAAKGIIRFGEVKDAADQRVAEYVLIGTMLSLSWAVAVSSLVGWFIG